LVSSERELQLRRLKVLVLASTFPRWLGDREPPFVFELSRRLAAHHDVTVLAPHAAGAKTTERMEGMDVFRFRYLPERWESLAYDGGILSNLKAYPWKYSLVPFFLLGQLVTLYRILRNERVDVIHAHWLFPQGLLALLARALARTRHTPLLCTSHGGDLFGLRGYVFSRLNRTVLLSAEAVTVVSNVMRDFAISLGGAGERIQVIPMGVDAAGTFLPPLHHERREDTLLFVGRLVEKKGLEYLLRALPNVVERRPSMRLVIVGSGPEEHSLKRLAREINIEDRVSFLGSVRNSELPELYRMATVFVGPSIATAAGDQEGLGLVFAEALACECPVIASDLPAIGDLVIDGSTGLVFRQRDTVDLANKLSRLLDDPLLRQSLGQEGRRVVCRQFDWSGVTERYSQLLVGLCSG
jgi:glycosyltransferase involved in cell wall biosynthesis